MNSNVVFTANAFQNELMRGRLSSVTVSSVVQWWRMKPIVKIMVAVEEFFVTKSTILFKLQKCNYIYLLAGIAIADGALLVFLLPIALLIWRKYY